MCLGIQHMCRRVATEPTALAHSCCPDYPILTIFAACCEIITVLSRYRNELSEMTALRKQICGRHLWGISETRINKFVVTRMNKIWKRFVIRMDEDKSKR